MKCGEVHQKVMLAAYGELADDQTHLLERHMAGCEACREEQQQLLALKTLASAYPIETPNANLVARSRTRLEEALDALPPKRWYDRLADWMTRTAGGLQTAPVAACLLLVAGGGLGSVAGYEFAQRHVPSQATAVLNVPKGSVGPVDDGQTTASEIANVSRIVRQPNSNLVEVSYNEIEPRHVVGPIEDPQVRRLLMLASQNSVNQGVRNDSVDLLAEECRAGHGCKGADVQGASVSDVLMMALRYDGSAAVREKALEGLQPFVSEDTRVRDAVLEALMNDPDAKIRSAAIGILEPVDADTSVRQVLSTVALSDENPHIRTASRLVLRRVSEIQ
jgi:anti-sigma factor RsiW